MRLDQWNSLPRDDMGRKVMVSDQFKTANTYNVDTVSCFHLVWRNARRAFVFMFRLFWRLCLKPKLKRLSTIMCASSGPFWSNKPLMRSIVAGYGSPKMVLVCSC